MPLCLRCKIIKLNESILMKKLILLILSVSILLTLLTCNRELPSPKPYNITCYAAGYGQGIYVSNNGGDSWYPLEMDQKDLYAYFKRLYRNPINKHDLYITTNGVGLFKTNISIGDIERVDQFKELNVTSLLFSDDLASGMSSFLLISLDTGGVYQSDDKLKSWQTRNQGLAYRDVNTLSSTGKDIYAGTTHDLFKWDKNENKWVSSSQGIKNKNILTIHGVEDNKTLLSGSGSYNGIKGRFEDIPCLYKSTDAGRSWQASDKGIPDGTLVYSLAVTRSKLEKIYAGTSDGVYLSIDKGESWLKTEEGLPKKFRVVDIETATMEDGSSVVYAVGSKGIFMTVDDGNSGWVGKNYGLPQTTMTSIIIVKNPD